MRRRWKWGGTNGWSGDIGREREGLGNHPGAIPTVGSWPRKCGRGRRILLAVIMASGGGNADRDHGREGGTDGPQS